jgi:RNA polymerase sigma factor (sigma-70 family)
VAYTDEIQLPAQSAAGNAFAQRLLYDKYAGPMMIVCSRYLPVREDAEEALMDAFYNCYKNIRSFTYAGEGNLRAWLKKIVVNQCLMQLRKKKLAFVDTADMAELPLPAPDGVLDSLSAKEIMKLVQGLPAGYRTVFNLYLFEGKSHKEIGELLGISESTSKTQLHKAKAQLQQQITNYQKC